MPFKLTWAERQIFLNHTWGPGPILDAFAPLALKVAHAGHTLGVFCTLQENAPLGVEEICKKTGTDAIGMGLLLETLCSLGYLQKKNGTRYINSPMTRTWLLNNSATDLSAMFGYFEDAFKRWSNLEEAILAGKPQQRGHAWLSTHPGSWDRYHAGLRTFAKLLAPQIAVQSRLPKNALRLIDVGGSHALYSVEFCRRYPGLEAIVFDQEHAQGCANETIAKHKMENRITFINGDILSGNLGSGFDAALLMNFVRVFSKEKIAGILSNVFGSLNKGGTILVADQFHFARHRSFAQANSLLIMLELFISGVGNIYTAAEVKSVLSDTGFVRIHETKLRRSPGISLISATRP